MLRFLGIGFFVATVSFAGLAITAVAFVKQVASRIVIDTDALGRAMHEAMISTLKEGTKEQKLELIASCATASPADPAPYAPLFLEATKDTDPEVRQAAIAALKRISPEADEPK